MTRTEQLISMIEDYKYQLEETDVLDELIILVSQKISEASKGSSFKEDVYWDDTTNQLER